jgi:hypothetical protein
MNTNNFKTFVEALEALPASIKADEVNIGSFLKPDHMCSDAGCFAGLISIVADDIPELKQAYKGKFYNSCKWKYALDRYLECDFSVWAKHNPKIWDNKHGVSMFVSPEAFGKEVFYKQGVYSKTMVVLGKPLTHYGIIVHIRKAYDRWIKLTEKRGTDSICFSEITQDEFIYRFRNMDAVECNPELLIDIFKFYNSREHLRYKSFTFDEVEQWINNALMFG